MSTHMIFRYVPIELALNYCRLGWLPTRALQDTNHGNYSVLMCWLCECHLVEAVRT